MRLRHAVAAAATLLPLLTAVPPALAEPPEGCVGFPDIPEAFVCVTSWTPENAVPTVTPGSETVWVPEFCVFACVGPTPVTVPLAAVTPNSGTIAVVRYQGQDYPITADQPVPPGFPPGIASTPVPAGFAGHGCTLLAVQDPSQPTAWVVIQHWGHIVATDPENELSSRRCYLTLDGEPVAHGPLLGWPTIAWYHNDFVNGVLGVCLRVEWTHAGDPRSEDSCVSATAVGSARIVV